MSSMINKAPGVYVRDTKPLLRPYQSADISTAGMITQVTLSDGASYSSKPVTLTSWKDFVIQFRGDALLMTLLRDAEIDWSGKSPRIGEETRNAIAKRTDEVLAELRTKPALLRSFSPLPNFFANPNGGEDGSARPEDGMTEKELDAKAADAKKAVDQARETSRKDEAAGKEERKKANEARAKATEARKESDSLQQAVDVAKAAYEDAAAKAAAANPAEKPAADQEAKDTKAAWDAAKKKADAAKKEAESAETNASTADAAAKTSETTAETSRKGLDKQEAEFGKYAGVATLRRKAAILYAIPDFEAGDDDSKKAEKQRDLVCAADAYVGALKRTLKYDGENFSKQAGAIAVSLWSIWGFFNNGGGLLHVFDVPSEQVDNFLKNGAAEKFAQYDVGILCAPGHSDVHSALASYAGRRDFSDPEGESFCFAVLDGARQVSATPPVNLPNQGELSDYESAAVYWPWLRVGTSKAKDANGQEIEGRPIVVPPSGFVAGVMARTDRGVGPHQAPAGDDAVIRGAVGLDSHVNEVQAGALNEKSVNCLRQFPGGDPVVFGARTLSKNPLYRYVSVSRLLMMIRKTVKTQTRWAVFKPNTHGLRKAVERTVYTYLEGLRRQGMLEGLKAADAFSVVCDETNNTEADRQLGILNINVAVAPVRPAEFIVFDVTQKVQAAK